MPKLGFVNSLLTKRAILGITFLAALAIGAGGKYLIGQEWSQELETDGPKGDCTFQRDPERFISGLRRHLEQLSRETERISGTIALHSTDSSPKTPTAAYVGYVPSRNYIDDFILARMQRDDVPHAPLCSDSEFIRRISLDLTGRIPTSFQVRAFANSTDPEKRRLLIREILYGPDSETPVWYGNAETVKARQQAFVDKWTMFFGDLLRNTSADSNVTRYIEGRNAFYNAIRDFLSAKTPYDVFVTKLLTASGDNFSSGEANWAVGGITPMGPVQDTYDTLWVRTATQFLGMSQFDCLLCHAGAGRVDKINLWSAEIDRSEAWELAAFFSRTQIRRTTVSQNPTKYAWTVTDTPNGDYRLNTTAGNRPPRQPYDRSATVVKPRYIFSDAPASGSSYREILANSLVRDRQFARATANYLWKEMMGMGMVEPADQFDLRRLDPAKPPPDGWSLQPSHPELLEALTEDFIGSGYDIRQILFLIADSSTYQLSCVFPGEWKQEYVPYFARKYVRRLWAEEIHDAITLATGVKASYRIEGFATPVEWAMQFPDTEEPRSNGAVRSFLNFFLRGDRDQNPRKDEAAIFQASNMMNSSFVLTRIRSSNRSSVVASLVSNKSLSDAELIDELFLRTLSRLPTPQEMSVCLPALRKDRTTGAENVQWALLNKVDFLYNY